MKKKAADSPFDWAGKILSRREHSEAELRRKMQTKGFGAEAIEQTCLRLKELGWLNDARFAAVFARDLVEVRRLGPFVVRAKLREKGLEDDIVERALSEVSNPETERRRLRQWIERRSRSLNESDPRKRRDKLFRFLAQKGFEMDMIRNVLEETMDGFDEE